MIIICPYCLKFTNQYFLIATCMTNSGHPIRCKKCNNTFLPEESFFINNMKDLPMIILKMKKENDYLSVENEKLEQSTKKFRRLYRNKLK